MNWIWLLFSVHGRVGRARFWLGFAIVFSLIMLIGVAAFVAALHDVPVDEWPDEESEISPEWIAAAFALGTLHYLSLVPIGVKRLHDRGKSGWWLAFYLLVPVVLHHLERQWLGEAVTQPFNLISWSIYAWTILDLGILRGTPGPNRFGDATNSRAGPVFA